jgi:glycosyltransferase involved in cell wall biosynthesis
VGNGELENDLKKSFGNKKSIHFIDFKNQSEMPAIYRASDVFILPSKGPGETWGLSINEAMASERAVLASDKCGGAIDLVEIGKNGYVFKANDLGDLIFKLKELASIGLVDLKKMGKASGIKITAFSYDRICEAIETQVCG